MNPSPTSFTDVAGKRWTIALTIGSVKRIKQEVGVDLLDLTNPQTLGRLLEPMTLAEVLWVSLADVAKAQDITEQTFAERLGGETIAAATDALLEAITDFSRPAQREAMKAGIRQFKRLEAEAVKEAVEKIDAMTLDDARQMAGV